MPGAESRARRCPPSRRGLIMRVIPVLCGLVLVSSQGFAQCGPVCDDDDPCTRDVLVAGDCQHQPIVGFDSRCVFGPVTFPPVECAATLPPTISQRFSEAADRMA